MYKFGRSSKRKLATVDSDLQKIANELIKLMDVTVLEGVRTEDRQKYLVEIGMSKTLISKHLPNQEGLSEALDLAPYPIDWQDRERFIYMQGMIRGIAHMMNIEIRSGIDWDGDGNIKDHTFFDGPHVEKKD